ncbi:acyltransferase family protein [Paenibacillus paeoniae]|uniref:DUF1624 domain-containing protein n=1 Tax=Paenibacillus paeoniae TaxID=2292705 RepID=A0A371PKZ1_9BACL|nr:acyltransferase family protein [Paenibacillus paeoniae]REK76862.1 DUF1624 domain-containing protein [Paenibacillus paeoniae]
MNKEINLNNSRQYELDAARGLAVIFMVLVHIVLEFGDRYTQEQSLYGYIVQFLGGIPAAPVFMFLLGVGIVYSKRSTPFLLLKRGLILIAAGYVFNLFRLVLPTWINSVRGWEEYTDSFTVFYENFFVVDILQFSGIAMLFFACFHRLQASNREYLLVLSLLMIANLALLPYIPYIETAANLPFLSMLIGTSDFSYFPFLTWIPYPIAGYVFGTFLIRAANKSVYYKRLLAVSSAIIVIYMLLAVYAGLPSGYESEQAYYHHTLSVNLFYIAFILSWISCLYFISKPLRLVAGKLLESASALTTEIYVIHFLLIGICMLLIYQPLGLGATILLTVITYCCSHIMAHAFIKFRSRKKG